MLTKERVKDLVMKMPDRFSIDELVEQLFILQKVETGRQQIKEGKYISSDNLDIEIESWK